MEEPKPTPEDIRLANLHCDGDGTWPAELAREFARVRAKEAERYEEQIRVLEQKLFQMHESLGLNPWD